MFPVALVLFAPYVAFYTLLGVLRLVGVRKLLARWLIANTAEVIDIGTGSPWRLVTPH
jgi:hypothetical protein